jgi:hypothetical protein
MSDSHLPDNFADWPTDSYQLLGVRQDVRHKELRRAYARLIRLFKPEHAPEEFRRIREAYEAIEPWVKRRDEWEQSNVEDVPPRDEVEPADDSPSNDTVSSEAPRSPGDFATTATSDEFAFPAAELSSSRRGESPQAELERLWNVAKSGDIAEAYPRMATLVEQLPFDETQYCRLYWMRLIAPELPDERDACAWLVAGLKRGVLSGRLLELYRQELDRRPHEVVEARSALLMDVNAPASRLYDLVSTRWSAMGRQFAWGLIADDIARLRPRFVDDRELWFRLLVVAIDQLAWSGDSSAEKLCEECHSELLQAEELHLTHADALDRVEIVLTLAASWKKSHDYSVHTVSKPLRQLLPLAWNRPFVEVRLPLQRYIESWFEDEVQEPFKAVDELREFQLPMLLYLNGLINTGLGWEGIQHDDLPLDRLRRLVTEFLDMHQQRDYHNLRGNILAFCKREFVTVAQIINTLADLPDYDQIGESSLIAWLSNDIAMQALVKAHHLLRS